MPVFPAQADHVSSNGGAGLWLFRSAAAWGRSMEFKYLKGPSLRRAVKALVDFACGSLSVLVAIALDRGIASFGVSETARLALAVGGFLVAAEALVGSYRTMCRYAGLQEAVVITTCTLVGTAALDALETRLAAWSQWVRLQVEAGRPDEAIVPDFEHYVWSELRAAGLTEETIAAYEQGDPAARGAPDAFRPSARATDPSDTDRRRGGAWALHQPGARPVAAPGGGAHRLCRR